MTGGLATWRVGGWVIYHLIAMLISLGILWKENKKAVLNTRFMLLISSVCFTFLVLAQSHGSGSRIFPSWGIHCTL